MVTLLDMATVCRYFRTARGCWYGDRCRFVHDRTCRFFKYAVTEMLNEILILELYLFNVHCLIFILIQHYSIGLNLLLCMFAVAFLFSCQFILLLNECMCITKCI